MYSPLYKLFRAKRTRNLKRLTWIAHDIWNYFLGWQRTRYALGLPYMSYNEMSRQFTILRKAHPEVFAHWDKRFFDGIAKRPPKFRSWRKPYSLTMSPSGYGFYGDKVRIQGKYYRFNLGLRPILGNIKTITLKEDSLGDFYMSVVSDHTVSEVIPKTGHAAGFDFGIKTMFTCSDGTLYESPEFYKTSMAALTKAERKHSRKTKGSNNRERSRKDAARVHRKIKRQRDNHHWKLAKHFVHKYDALYFETLTLYQYLRQFMGR